MIFRCFQSYLLFKSVIFVNKYGYIQSNWLILFLGTSAIFLAHQKNFTQILFIPGGNFGPNCYKRYARLVVENGFFRKKWPFFGTNIDFSKNFYCPQSFSGGGLYLNGIWLLRIVSVWLLHIVCDWLLRIFCDWLLWIISDGLLWSNNSWLL